MSTKRVMFLTGATGVVGRAVLAAATPDSVIALAHRARLDDSAWRRVQGDITQPRLGLSPGAYDDLCSRIDCVVHSAAATRVDVPAQDVLRINCDGTENVLELASKARVPFYYVSTAFVQSDSNSIYQESKRSAEQLVEKSGVASTIIRPSIIVGDSESGWIAHFQGLHHLMATFLQGNLPLLPGSLESLCDFVPQDLVARFIVSLVETGQTGREYWLTAGPNACPLGLLLDTCIEFAREHGETIVAPRSVSIEAIDRLFLPVFMPVLPRRVQRQLATAIKIFRHLNDSRPFETSLPEVCEAFAVPPPPRHRSLIMRNLAYWARSVGYPSSRVAQPVSREAP